MNTRKLAAAAALAALALPLAACGSQGLTASDKSVCRIVRADLKDSGTAGDYVNDAVAMLAMAPETTQPLRGDMTRAAHAAEDEAAGTGYERVQTGGASGPAVVGPSLFGQVTSDCGG
jgi:hypothetical protein